MLSAFEKLKEAGTEVVELCSGDIDGEAFYAFIKMDLDSYVRYQHDRLQGGVMDLPSYGAVIETGWGSEPDQDTKDRITREYSAFMQNADKGTNT